MVRLTDLKQYVPKSMLFMIYIAICRRPSLIPVCTCSADSIPRLVGFDDNITPVEGSTVRFSCPPGLELIGPDSATCRENGEWGPDIKGIMCNHSAKGYFSQAYHVHV